MAPTATGTTNGRSTQSAPQGLSAKTSIKANGAKKPTLIDLYSGSQASMAITDETLRKDIITGLRGSQTYIIPGSVDNTEDRKFAFRR